MDGNFVSRSAFWMALLIGLGALSAEAAQPVKYGAVENYFLKNTIRPAEGESALSGILRTQEQFDSHFGPAAVMWRNQRFLSKDFFNSGVILFFAEWGDTPWQYKIQSVTRDGNVLTVSYTRAGEPSSMATFSPCLLISVSKDLINSESVAVFKRVEQ